MQQELLQLAACGLPWAEQRAQMALQISEAVIQGQMSKDEARTLLDDLVNTD
jgi:polyhydroxyalkanoate synthesis regulator phasin